MKTEDLIIQYFQKFEEFWFAECGTRFDIVEIRAIKKLFAEIISAAKEEQREDNLQCQLLYNELIYAVGTKFPGETRHQTALRYIQETEKRTMMGEPASDIRKENTQ